MMDKPLNEIMEFDHVIKVDADGTISDSGIYAPELYMEVDSEAKSAGWELLSGFTGQYGYNGPVLHPSEFIGGGLERHILSHPGYYVVLEVSARCDYDGTTDCDIESGCDCEPAGWAVAFKPSADSDRASEGYCSICYEPTDEMGAEALCAYHRDSLGEDY